MLPLEVGLEHHPDIAPALTGRGVAVARIYIDDVDPLETTPDEVLRSMTVLACVEEGACGLTDAEIEDILRDELAEKGELFRWACTY